ncbi:MAG TPA: UDP-glucose/GDP-mannose dehydrogenase family protein [Candidatus Limnocylindrales bacterium]|nr:UDP-glucose/GDP-mannose dehydrogenase family protein [Candidatus Limnocylindrales bacterium]
MRVAVVGLGYVGLVTSACLAEEGHHIVGVEVSVDRIEALKAGRLPLHEPGLDELVHNNRESGRLTFVSDSAAVATAEVVFVAVGTHDGNGGWQTGTIQSCLHDVVPLLADDATLVVRSTLPPWFLARLPTIVSRIRQEAGRPPVPVLLNPEFTKEGTAVRDFLEPERIVLGIAMDVDGRGEAALRRLYGTTEAPILAMPAIDASLSKLGANLFLATKISFANELAQLCDLYGGDIERVVSAMAYDHRIGGSFLRAGIGFGGSCLPHQVTMTVVGAAEDGIETPLFAAVAEVNHRQRRLLVDLLEDRIGGSLAGARIALLGVTFKPNTDDLREAPSIDIATELRARGATVVAFDPMRSALVRFAETVPGVQIADSAALALAGADAAGLVTEWEEFYNLDWTRLAGVMRSPIVVDGRNALPADVLRAAGIDYTGFGRGSGGGRGSARALEHEVIAVMDDSVVADAAVAPQHSERTRGSIGLVRTE